MASDCLIHFDKSARGEAKDAELPNALEVLSWRWGATHENRGAVPGKAGRGDLHDLIFIYRVDSATPTLLQHCLQATVMPKVTMVMRRQGSGTQEYINLTLTKSRVVAVDLRYSEGDLLPLAEVRLSFAKADLEYKPQSEQGYSDTRQGPVSLSWITDLFT